MVPTGPQVERIFAPGWIISRTSLILKLDDEVWEFSADKAYWKVWTWIDVMGWEIWRPWMRWTYFACEMNMNLWKSEGGYCWADWRDPRVTHLLSSKALCVTEQFTFWSFRGISRRLSNRNWLSLESMLPDRDSNAEFLRNQDRLRILPVINTRSFLLNSYYLNLSLSTCISLWLARINQAAPPTRSLEISSAKFPTSSLVSSVFYVSIE